MNKLLMTILRGMDRRYLEETADGGDGGGGAPTPADPPPANPPSDPPPAGTEPPKDGEGGPRPFLGDQKPADGDARKEGEQTPKDGEPPKAPDEAAYLSALKKDTALLGDNAELQLDQDLYKAVLPVAQKYNVPPEALNDLANALAKAQIDEARTRLQDRVDYFNKMKQQSLQTYTPRDFEQINAGIDKWFKPGGVMNSVIRNSELGADPEFLALMHHLGAASATDNNAGAGAGGGGVSVDPNTTQGMSGIW